MNSIHGNQNINGLAAAFMYAKRRKVFVSYLHDNDQFYYDEFTRLFHNQYEAIRNNSLDRIIQSNDSEYVMRQIREQHINGTSCTIVLIGKKS